MKINTSIIGIVVTVGLAGVNMSAYGQISSGSLSQSSLQLAQSWQNYGNVDFAQGQSPQIEMEGKRAFVAFRDLDHGGRISVKTYAQGMSGWSYVGAAGFSPASTTRFNMELYQGQPFVVFTDSTQGGKLTAMRYDRDQGQWVVHGNPGFTPASVSSGNVDLEISGRDSWVAFRDTTAGNGVTVMRYDGVANLWKRVGQAGFSPDGTPLLIDLELRTHKPYVAYMLDSSSGGKFIVQHYTQATGWSVFGTIPVQPVGGASVSWPLDLEISGEALYLAINHPGTSRATVLKRHLAASQWQVWGQPQVTESPVMSLDMEVNKNKLVIAYKEQPYDANISVKQADMSAHWQGLGPRKFTYGWMPTLALDGTGKPCIATTNPGTHRLNVLCLQPVSLSTPLNPTMIHPPRPGQARPGQARPIRR